MSIILPAKAHLVVVDGEQAMIRDRNAVSVACQVVQNVLGPAKRGLGVHHPILSEQAAHESRKRLLLSQRQADAMEDQLVSLDHTGTIPSKTVREAIFQLSGLAVNALYGNGSRTRADIFVSNITSRVNAIVARETEVIRAQLQRNGIAMYQGSAVFLDSHTVEVEGDGAGIKVKGSKILVACGTRPAHSPDIPFDNHRM
jgi:hypothetical protein